MIPLRIGIVGTGNISGIYFKNLQEFVGTEVIACADLDLERARAAAEKHGIGLVLSPDELIAHPDIELVLNLTIPAGHAAVSLQAVNTGKHAYNEKPLAVEFCEGQKLMSEAERRGVIVGSAPDTFLGAGHQEARAIVDSGALGELVSVTGFMLCGGHESWHPSPGFYYAPGGGPLFDMGPYYITAFVNMLGPIKHVSGASRIVRTTRTIGSQPLAGQTIKVGTPTHVAATFEFASGVIGQLTTSFDVPVGKFPSIVVSGTAGSMVVPDPNGFGGEVEVRRAGENEWTTVKPARPYAENARGVGVLDMALAIREGRAHRASGALGLHVLEAMHAVLRSAETGQRITLETTVARPEPMRLETLG